MSLTNDQITAKNFQAYHNLILPYLNGQVPTFANAFSRGDILSTTEKIVGTDTDGMPIWQRMVSYTPSSTITFGGQSTRVEIADLSSWNIEKVIGEESVLINNYSASDFHYSALPIFEIWSGAAYTAIDIYQKKLNLIGANRTVPTTATVYIKLQYTKVGDTPIKVGTGNDYSTEEQIVGTWIDGSYVYQRTYSGINISANGDYSITISNISKVISVEGFGSLLPVIYPDRDGNNGVVGTYFNNGVVHIVTGTSRSVSDVAITIKYTKTT